MNQNYYQEDVGFDLLQMIKRLCVQWRAILTVSVIFGLVVMCGRYAKDTRAYKDALNGEESILEKTSVENAVLDEKDGDSVILKKEIEKEIEEKESYLRDSLRANIDVNNYQAATVLYLIETEGNSDAYDVAYFYKYLLYKDKKINSLKEKLGLECEPCYVKELLWVSSVSSDENKSGTEWLKVTFVVPDGLDENIVLDALRDLVDDTTEANDWYNYQITYVDGDITRIWVPLTDDLREEKTNILNELMSLRKSLDSMGNVDETDESVSMVTPQSACFDVKSFLLGAFFGIVLYVGLYSLYIVLNFRAVELGVMGLSGFPVLGLVKVGKEKKSAFEFLLKDAAVERLLFGKEEALLSRPENIIGQMRMRFGNEEKTHVQILQVGFDSSEADEVKCLIRTGKEMGVDVSVVALDVKDVKSVLERVDASGAAVVSVYEEKTIRKDVCTLYEMLYNRQITILGELYIKEA